MSSRGTASSKRIQAAERRERAWELRKRGFSFRKIAQELAPVFGESYSKSQTERDIKRVLDELNERTLETAAQARATDLARLDDLLAAWYVTALREHERPIDAEPDESGDIVASWFARVMATAGEEEHDESAGEKKPLLDAIDWSKLAPMDLLDAFFKQANLSKQAVEIVLRILEQRAKLLGLHRQEIALTTPSPLKVGADLSDLDEATLNAIIRNLTTALGAGTG